MMSMNSVLEYLSTMENNYSFLIPSSVCHFGAAIISLWFLTISPTVNIILIASWVLVHVLTGTYLFLWAKNIEIDEIKDFKLSLDEKIELGIAGDVSSSA
jgi:hypothetical protein